VRRVGGGLIARRCDGAVKSDTHSFPAGESPFDSYRLVGCVK
jgi:hypothetical protein